MIDAILADLRGIFGAKVLLNPEDLVEALGISTGQQANLRSKGKFPVKTQKVGGRVKVSIYDLAQHLSGQATTHVKGEIAKIPDQLPRAVKKARKGLLEKDWWAFRQKAVISIINKSLLDFELSCNFEEKTKKTKGILK